MNWKGLLKILAISFVIICGVGSGLLMWGLAKLPSAFEIKQTLTPPVFQKTTSKEGTPKTTSSSASVDSAPGGGGLAIRDGEQPKSNKEKIAALATKVIFEDFSDVKRPLVDGCRNLTQASESHFFRDPQNASGSYFFESLALEKKDPLSETAAPIFRYIFRAPGMPSVVETILKAEDSGDTGLLKKAEFYYEIYRAGDFLKGHLRDMDAILQKSYNMHHLAKAVAQRPELARDPATVSFCEQMEKNVNESGEYDAEEAAGEMMKFLRDSGIEAKSIDYDPNYRSKVKLNLSSTQVTVNNTWVVKLFARDIEKAQRESAHKN